MRPPSVSSQRDRVLCLVASRARAGRSSAATGSREPDRPRSSHSIAASLISSPRPPPVGREVIPILREALIESEDVLEHTEADECRRVHPSLLEHLGGREMSFSQHVVVREGSVLRRLQTGKERGVGRHGAGRSRIGPGEADAGLRETVDVRRVQRCAVAAHVVGAERVGDDDDDIRRRSGSRLISSDHGSLPENLAVERGETDVHDASLERREIDVNPGAPAEIARPYERLRPPVAVQADLGMPGGCQLQPRSSREADTEDQLCAGSLAEAVGHLARRVGRGTHLGGRLVIVGDHQPVERSGARGSSGLIGVRPVEAERDPILAETLCLGREAHCVGVGTATELPAPDGARVQRHVNSLRSLGARRPAPEDQPAIAGPSELDIEVCPRAPSPGEARSIRRLGRHGPAAREQAEATLFLGEVERGGVRAGPREPKPSGRDGHSSAARQRPRIPDTARTASSSPPEARGRSGAQTAEATRAWSAGSSHRASALGDREGELRGSIVHVRDRRIFAPSRSIRRATIK